MEVAAILGKSGEVEREQAPEREARAIFWRWSAGCPMRLALVGDARVEPVPKARALCPSCLAPVSAKCGRVNAWHWAHDSLQDCDTWSEGETHWHAWWKDRAPVECREVAMGPHRADIRLADGLVIEVQHSPLSVDDITEREAFYGEMIWILDGSSFRERFELRPEGDYHTFRWRSPRRNWFAACCPIWIDFGTHVFEVKKLHGETPCGGWGYLWKKKDVLGNKLRAMTVTEARQDGRVECRASHNDHGYESNKRAFGSIAEARAWMESYGFEHPDCEWTFEIEVTFAGGDIMNHDSVLCRLMGDACAAE